MKNSILVLAFFTVCLPFFSSAQQQASIATSARADKPSWHPISLTSDGKNAINGVEFLKKTESCNYEELLVVKLINRNSHPVKISWKSIDGSEKTIEIKANSESEGSCLAFINRDEKNPAFHLSMQKSKINTADKETVKKELLGSLKVVELK